MIKYIEWMEPVHVNDIYVADQIIKMTTEHAIKLFRATHPELDISDENALEDFISIHWAYFIL